MRGRGDETVDKWWHINQLMKDEKINVLAVQETHLDEETAAGIQDRFERQLKIYHSQPLENPTRARGVALVLNARSTNIEGVQEHNLIPGRALMLTLPWHNTQVLNILAVYAPNDPRENGAFWEELREIFLTTDTPPPHVMLGDFNVVEAPIDRFPPHADAQGATQPLATICRALELSDSWRTENPDTRLYTYHQSSTGSRSRIDRIYAAPETSRAIDTWRRTVPPIPSDHDIMRATILDRKTPHTGKGRWSIPPHIWKNKEFISDTVERGERLTRALKSVHGAPRSATTNPQTLWKQFKRDINAAARQRAKKHNCKLDVAIAKLEHLLEIVENDVCPDTDEDSHKLELDEIHGRLAKLKAARHAARREAIAAKHFLEGEALTRYWMQLGKEHTPREVTYKLTAPRIEHHPPAIATKSKDMAELSRDYYDHVQEIDLYGTPPAEREQNIQAALDAIELTLTEEQSGSLSQEVTRQDVLNALKSTGPGKAPGLDGIPYELWKAVQNACDSEKHRNPDAPVAFDLLGVLTEVYQDIEQHGVDETTDFAEGWIWQKWKEKGDRNAIPNYRPITLLNTDYKLFTKTIAMRLAAVAPSLIHPDQTGFIPNRSIFDNIRQVQLLLDRAEPMSQNGIIVALDQEKAYDRISHDYLWRVLERQNIPPSLITTLKSLYATATSVAIVNGEQSSSFRVTRGVRQGDPVSCLLFNMAIEPLAALLRASTLQGITIPETGKRIICSLFADDTTVYLSELDDFAQLQSILKTWCTAARAKFNAGKTEIIPMGSPEYRERLRTTRRLHEGGAMIPDAMDITHDGQHVRILGAWIGNGVQPRAQWNQVLQRVNIDLDRWAKLHPTLRGKQKIINIVVGGRMQFLAATQGVPEDVIAELRKLTSNFLWDGNSHPPIAWDTVTAPINEGGLGVLDPVAKAEAIELSRAKALLDLSGDQPNWAPMAHELIAENALKSAHTIPQKAKLNTFLQLWDPSTGPQSALPAHLRRLLKTAKKYNVTIDAVKLTTEMKRQMPAWYHIGVERQLTSIRNSAAKKCLLNNHEVKTMGDLVHLQTLYSPTPERHHRRRNCACTTCKNIRQTTGCTDPDTCQRTATHIINNMPQKWNPRASPPPDGLSLTHHRKTRNEIARKTNDEITFNPTLNTDGGLTAAIRVFGEPSTQSQDPANRKTFQIPGEAITVYTDGSATKNGDYDAAAGGGIFYGPRDPRNRAIRVYGPTQTNQAGEIAAIYHLAKQEAGLPAPLHIVSDSRYAIDGLTVNLQKWEAKGYAGVENAEYFRAAVSWLRQRGAETTLQWVKGHAGIAGNEGADELAKQGASLPQDAAKRPETNAKFALTGACLRDVSQSEMYKHIKARKPRKPRRATETHLDMTRYAVQAACGRTPTDKAIWRTTKHPDFHHKTRDFLWKTMNNAYRVGKWWENIPGYEERATCQHCGVEDSMAHILTECTIPGQQQIWELTEYLWRKKNPAWHRPTIGLILGAGLVEIHDREGKINKGATRLYRILMTESAHLIWRIRCLTKIEHDGDPVKWLKPAQLAGRWSRTINARIKLDQHITRANSARRKTSRHSLLTTWSRVLANEDELPQDWSRERGVLVSTDPPELLRLRYRTEGQGPGRRAEPHTAE